MKKREKIIGIIMLVVIAIWGVTFLSQREKKKFAEVKEIADPDSKLPGVPGIKKEELVDKMDLPKLIADKKIRAQSLELSSIKDPFLKLEPQEAKKELFDLVLTGVIWEKGEPIALINEEILKTGDTVSGYRIEEIKEDGVILIRGTERRILELFIETKTEPEGGS